MVGASAERRVQFGKILKTNAVKCDMAIAAKNVVESFRDAVQDLLMPEFKALKISVDALREDMHELRADMKESADSPRTEMKLRDDRQDQAMRNLTEKLSFAIDIRERLASLEARMPRQ